MNDDELYRGFVKMKKQQNQNTIQHHSFDFVCEQSRVKKKGFLSVFASHVIALTE